MQSHSTHVPRQLKFLQVYSVALTFIVALLVWQVFFHNGNGGHFKEVTAERINIVEKDGTLRIVMANRERQHPGIVDGKSLPMRDRGAGFIFFNDEGDECGGYVWSGEKGAADMGFSLDQYANDQIVQLQYQDEAGRRHYGLKMWDRNDDFPTGKLIRIHDSLKALNDTALLAATLRGYQAQGLIGQERLFVGKTENRAFGLFLRDDRGRPRLSIGVDSLNQLIFEAYDSTGTRFP